MWLDRCVSPSTGSLDSLQKMASAGSTCPITRSLHWGHTSRFQGVSMALGFYIDPEKSFNSNQLSQYSLPPPLPH